MAWPWALPVRILFLADTVDDSLCWTFASGGLGGCFDGGCCECTLQHPAHSGSQSTPKENMINVLMLVSRQGVHAASQPELKGTKVSFSASLRMRRHGSSKGGCRHCDHGRQLQQHCQVCAMGPVCLQQHPKVSSVSADGESSPNVLFT